MFKKLQTAILGLAIAASAAVAPVSADESTDLLAIGNYVKFGNYNGYNVIYEVADIDDVNSDGRNEFLLLSRYAITYKAFDTTSSVWADSTLRTWLNSDETSVTWGSKVPDDSTSLTKPYADEAGFMTGMSEGGKKMIVPVEHGAATDKVFILSQPEHEAIKAANQIEGINPGTWTNATGTSSTLTWRGRTSWTRTIVNSNTVKRSGYDTGNNTNVYGDVAVTNENTGVRPAMWIGSDFEITGGTGADADNAYTIGYVDNDQNLKKYVKLGSYAGNNLIYQIVDKKDANGDGDMEYLIVSRYIMAYRAFDPATKVWKDSSLRAWLNANGDVTYTDANRPSSANGLKDYPYDTEKGFLTAWMPAERDMIVPSLTDGDPDVCDSVFILSRAEYEALPENKVPGCMNYDVPGCKEPVEDEDGNIESWNMYLEGRTAWTRTLTKAGDQPYYTYHQSNSAQFAGVNPNDERIGVRPAMYISVDKFAPVEGDGTLESPYSMIKTEIGAITATDTHMVVHYKNPNGYDLDYALIAATYDGDVLLNVTIERGMKALTEGDLKISRDSFAGAEKVKIMLWNMETLRPTQVAVDGNNPT